MKPCKKCGETKPFSEFYANPQLRDGHINTCKPCWTAKGREYHAKPENKERKRIRQREYRSNPEKKAMELRAEKAWRTEPRNRVKLTEKQRAYRQQHADRYRAHRLVAYAVKTGRLAKGACCICGDEAEAHHDDYNQPLQVRWLCRRHHVQTHIEARAA
jgi:hypothetical protein